MQKVRRGENLDIFCNRVAGLADWIWTWGKVKDDFKVFGLSNWRDGVAI